MRENNPNFSYRSDVEWLSTQGRPYYYGIILILIYLGFYNLAFFYALCAISIIWQVDEFDRIEEELEDMDEKLAWLEEGYHRVILMENMSDFVDSVVYENPFSYNKKKFRNFFVCLDKLSSSLMPHLCFSSHNKLLLNPTLSKKIKKRKLKKRAIKIDDRTLIAAISRRDNRLLLDEKLLQFKTRLLSTTKFENRRLIKQRLKKITEMAIQLEEDLLLLQISADSKSIFLLGSFYKSGLFAISAFDFDRILYHRPEFIIYDEYFVFNKYLKAYKSKDVATVSKCDFYLYSLISNS